MKDRECTEAEMENEAGTCTDSAAQNCGEEQKEEGDGRAGENEAAPDASQPEKKGFFSKKKDKRDQQIEELTDQLKRNMAEFDNFRKRTEKEKSAMYEIGAKDVIEKILPVIDNFERG